MKKVLSLVLSLVMVVATFAMLVPTASAADATYNTVLYEDFDGNAANGGKAFDTAKTNSDLLVDIFGDSCIGNFHSSSTAAYDNQAKGLRLYSGTNTNPRIILDESIDLSVGAEVVIEATIDVSDDGAARFFAVTGGTVDGGRNDRFFAGLYRNATARVGFRMASNQWACDMSTNPAVAEGTLVRMRTVVSLADVALYVAKWDAEAGAYGEEVLAGSAAKTAYLATAQADSAKYFAPGITLEMQDKTSVVLHSVEVKELVPAAVLPEAPAVTTSAGSVLYTQDFSNAAYAGKTDAELADAIFGEGNHNAAAQGTKLSLVDGALKIDTTAAGQDFFHALLVDDAVISEGYVAEMDYTFHSFETSSTLDGRFISFSTHGNVTQNNWVNVTVVGPYAPGVNANSPNARVATRPGGAWKGWTSAYATPANVNTYETTYRMRATITQADLKLEVAKYTDGVLGDYVQIATAAHDTPSKTLGDFLTLFIQKQDVVTVDNIEVTSLTSTPINSFAGHQTGANQIRLVGLLDTATFTNATAVGFEVAILGKGEFKTLECNYVYESIDSKTAASLNAGYDYLYAMHITEIPAGEYTFRVVPYYVLDGETVYGVAKDFMVNIANAQ